MKLQIKKKLLLEKLNMVELAISSKAVDPALLGIKFELSEKGLNMVASNAEIIIETFIEKNDDMIINETGGTIIPAKYFLEIIKKTPSKSISIEVLEDQKILINLGKSEFNLNGMSTTEYPKIDLSTKKNKVRVSASEFKEGINQVSFATSQDEGRPVINGINLKITGNLLEISATDSYRLGTRVIKLDETIKEDVNITLPKTSTQDIVKLINEEKDLQFSLFDNRVVIESDNFIFQSVLNNGVYPNVAGLFPDKFNFSINIDVDKIYNAIDMASILTNDREKNIVNLEIKDKKMIISSISQEVGHAYEELELTEKFDNFKISFSPRFMLDALKAFNSKEITLSFLTDSKPIVITEEKTNNLKHLVLPIRTY